MKKYLLIIVILSALLVGSYYLFSQRPETTTPNQTQETTQSFSYTGVEGKTALELLRENFQVETRVFDFGEMVKSINGIEPDADYFWAFYVNQQIANEGASTYITKDNDQIEWRLERIQ